jgi:hypothetical protein
MKRTMGLLLLTLVLGTITLRGAPVTCLMASIDRQRLCRCGIVACGRRIDVVDGTEWVRWCKGANRVTTDSVG